MAVVSHLIENHFSCLLTIIINNRVFHEQTVSGAEAQEPYERQNMMWSWSQNIVFV